MTRRCSANALAYASAPHECRSFVEPSTSVKRKVTVPLGRSSRMRVIIRLTLAFVQSCAVEVEARLVRDRALARLPFVPGRRCDPCYQPCYQTERAQRNRQASKRLNKPDALAHTSSRRYRTQEVAGSSPASSINETPGISSELSG